MNTGFSGEVNSQPHFVLDGVEISKGLYAELNLPMQVNGELHAQIDCSDNWRVTTEQPISLNELSSLTAYHSRRCQLLVVSTCVGC